MTDVASPESCTEAEAIMSANFYVPGEGDLKGPWIADGDVPLSLVFNNGEILRTKQLTPACDNATVCDGIEAVTATGTYDIDNALIRLEWDNNTGATGMSLPELFYTLKLCTGAVVVNEAHPTYGAVTYSRYEEGQ
ncbi:MAG: hypothetical protein VYE15_04790 [Myxococcota bacterium]|nr:hypothetical protein [Myxococcota bacterium]